jgi:hypothetical protein
METPPAKTPRNCIILSLPIFFPLCLIELSMLEIYLASQSPRRMQLLEKAGISFHPLPTHSSETIDEKLTVDAQILSISRQKLERALISLKNMSKIKIIDDDDEFAHVL